MNTAASQGGMTAPLVLVEAPTAPDLSAAPEYVRKLTTTNLPVIAIHNAGRTLAQALRGVEPLLPEGVYINRSTPVTHFGAGRWSLRAWTMPLQEDSGWHIDDHAHPEYGTTLNFHFNDGGEVEGNYAQPVNHRAALPQEDRDLLNRGRVDPERFDPVGYRTVSRQGTLVVFKGTLAHNFKPRTRFRRSSVVLGMIMRQSQPE